MQYMQTTMVKKWKKKDKKAKYIWRKRNEHCAFIAANGHNKLCFARYKSIRVVNTLIYANETKRNKKRRKEEEKKNTFCKIRYSVAFSSRFYYLVTVTVVVAVDRPKKIHFWIRSSFFFRLSILYFFGVYAEHVTGKSHSWNTEIGSSRRSVTIDRILEIYYTLNATRSTQRNSWKISRTNGNLWRQMATTIRQYMYGGRLMSAHESHYNNWKSIRTNWTVNRQLSSISNYK